jgi:hypothetical protein
MDGWKVTTGCLIYVKASLLDSDSVRFFRGHGFGWVV